MGEDEHVGESCDRLNCHEFPSFGSKPAQKVTKFGCVIPGCCFNEVLPAHYRFSCSMFSAMLCAKHMPKGPKGQKRPADVIGNAVHVMRIATGETEESGQTEDGKSKAAVELGRKGGLARAQGLSTKKKHAIAKKAALARWNK
jgi:hypothetical protein